MAIQNFPTELQPLIQTGMLWRETEEGLGSVVAYRDAFIAEWIPNGIGETVSKTKTGRKAPKITPLNAATRNDNFDNGLTPSGAFEIERYTFTLSSYGDTVDIDLLTDTVGIARTFITMVRNSAEQAGHSLEQLARNKLMAAYLSGNTRVLAGPTATTALLDDVTGFETVLVNGVPTAISVSNPITAVEFGSGGAVRTLSITGVAVDVVNVSTNPYGRSGTITFVSNPTPAVGNAIVATNAPAVLRAQAALTTATLGVSGVLTFAIIQDAEAYLRDNAVPACDDGTYHCVLNNTSMRHLYADQQFQTLYAGRAKQDAEYTEGQIVQLAGITFIPTTEAVPVAMDNDSSVRIRVQRPIIMGGECAIQANFEGLDTFLNNIGVNMSADEGEIALVDGVLHVTREPLSRYKTDLAISWLWIGDFAIPTDATATSDIIPTASSALYKRCVIIEHVG